MAPGPPLKPKACPKPPVKKLPPVPYFPGHKLPAAKPVPPQQPAIGGKEKLATAMHIQELKVQKLVQEGKCSHWKHLQPKPGLGTSSGSLDQVATKGTGAPSSRPLAAAGLHQAGDPETLGRDVAQHVETQRQTSGAWKASSIAVKRLPAECCIRHKLHESLGPQLKSIPPGVLCQIMTGAGKDIKALCISLVGNNPQKIGDSLEKGLEQHPLVCPPSIDRKVLKDGMHRIAFTDMHNTSWVIYVLAMPAIWNSPLRFVAVLQQRVTILKMTDTESATLGNLLCSLVGHQPPWPNAMGGINSGDPNVGNDLAQAQAKHDSEQSAVGDVSVRDSSGPLGDVDQETDSGSDEEEEEEAVPDAEEEAMPDADYDVDHDDESSDVETQDEARTPEDDPHVDPDRGGGDLLQK